MAGLVIREVSFVYALCCPSCTVRRAPLLRTSPRPMAHRVIVVGRSRSVILPGVCSCWCFLVAEARPLPAEPPRGGAPVAGLGPIDTEFWSEVRNYQRHAAAGIAVTSLLLVMTCPCRSRGLPTCREQGILTRRR